MIERTGVAHSGPTARAQCPEKVARGRAWMRRAVEDASSVKANDPSVIPLVHPRDIKHNEFCSERKWGGGCSGIRSYGLHAWSRLVRVPGARDSALVAIGLQAPSNQRRHRGKKKKRNRVCDVTSFLPRRA